MAAAPSAALVDDLGRFRLLEPAQLWELPALVASFPDPKALAGELLRRGWLTPYQANQLLRGRGRELLLGSYVLLERLGEGGMGAVFKARNWKLGRVVALKLIRKELLGKADAVGRFRREVRAAAALSHPNIVHAYDADETDGAHLLVMEFVEGAADLARLVERDGPLPAPRACELARQAALGLQHACERGLVHRDIKPHNLLLTADGRTVKILDLGLARLHRPLADDRRSSVITREGVLMGTPDYVAPEQADRAHAVDIRADLYSLGCTLYFLLAGRPPFSEGTVMEKLIHHCLHEPAPVEAVRPDVPAAVAAVVRKLMAKRPEDRFQTPADAAAALAAATTGVVEATVVERRAAATETATAAPSSPFADLRLDHTVALESPRRRARRRPWRLLGAAGGGLALAGVLALLFLLFQKPAASPPATTGGGPGPPDAPSPQAAATVDEAWLKKVAALPAEKQAEAVAAKLKEQNPGFDGQATHKTNNGVVVEFQFLADQATDISPVRALAGLKTLRCGGSPAGGCRLADLSPLKGMTTLTGLDCPYTKVVDLSPLKGLPLTYLECGGTKVSDLSPLTGMSLAELRFGDTSVADLSPLTGMSLTTLICNSTPVSDLAPLHGMKLTHLECGGTKVSDLAPLKGMPLATLGFNGTKVADLSPLKEMPLAGLNCGGTPVSDLSPLKGVPLTSLNCSNTMAADLSPLKDMKLSMLWCDGTKVADLAPLAGMPLVDLRFSRTPVSDLAPLKGMKLTMLTCNNTAVSDLSPLKGMPLRQLWCDFRRDRDAEVLHSLGTLEWINGKPAKEFWKEVDEKKP
jgi:Leucine-rich repeat (LRR) protein/tRNA A-37 threonylcarbamoyl transferase component Bud32